MRNYFDPPQPAIIIAQSRSGSSFLCHCLDSHYQIGCERGELFSLRYGWQKLGVGHRDLIVAFWGRLGYRVSMFKVGYKQIRFGYMTAEILQEFKPKVIHLYRNNVLNAIISRNLGERENELKHPVHTYEPVKQQEVEIDCNTLLDNIEEYLQQIDTTRHQLLDGLEVLELTYEAIGNNQSLLPQAIANNICQFLGVAGDMSMFSEMVKVNPAPIIMNKEQIRETLKGTGHEWML